MKTGLRYALPVMLLLAGCATNDDHTMNVAAANNAVAPVVAPPQRVEAVSDAVGAKMNSLVASRPSAGNSTTQ